MSRRSDDAEADGRPNREHGRLRSREQREEVWDCVRGARANRAKRVDGLPPHVLRLVLKPRGDVAREWARALAQLLERDQRGYPLPHLGARELLAQLL